MEGELYSIVTVCSYTNYDCICNYLNTCLYACVDIHDSCIVTTLLVFSLLTREPYVTIYSNINCRAHAQIIVQRVRRYSKILFVCTYMSKNFWIVNCGFET